MVTTKKHPHIRHIRKREETQSLSLQESGKHKRRKTENEHQKALTYKKNN